MIDAWYQKPAGVETRWATCENPRGEKGAARAVRAAPAPASARAAPLLWRRRKGAAACCGGYGWRCRTMTNPIA